MPSSAPRIAVIDDDPQMLIALQRLLRPHGYDVMTFSSGSQYLDLILGTAPDCLLVDLEMPGCSGLEMVRALQTAGHEVPVVFMTADEREQHLGTAERDGCMLLCKPFRATHLIDALKCAVQTERRNQL